MALGTRNNLGYFRDVPFNPLNTENLFQHFRGNPCLLATLWENEWTDFHEIVRVAGTRYQEQSVTFSGKSVSVSNITGK